MKHDLTIKNVCSNKKKTHSATDNFYQVIMQ